MYNNERLEIDRKRKLRYVKVYEKLYELIKDGTYPVNSQLPPENDLAKQMGVSRMTLRQALQFLQDDGVLKIQKGKGNFVISNSSKWATGLETITNPIPACLDIEVDEVEIDFHIEPSTEYTNEILQRKVAVVVFIDRWYKSKGQPVAFTFSTMPVEVLTEKEIDLKDIESFKSFLETKIYQEAKHTKLQVQYSEVGNISAVRYKISEKDQFYLIQEEIYLGDDYPSLHNKHYLPIDKSHIEINGTK
ncbi:GntR family transcriptional regulator [Candidatus Enterococcus murrayae]|uniref:GntR family transcriptional regulator n=1 Tax=Candidatus Enterococcus murrayae TaxID=2815321 RepID=A0ABS3HDJ1_9ENTE|nr:GntR family transcriptional regulator [Enterococcus sp. MJM16]MBO0451524.1 GntR family transcriptional regulator [Enterococcus sp. MJM16]